MCRMALVAATVLSLAATSAFATEPAQPAAGGNVLQRMLGGGHHAPSAPATPSTTAANTAAASAPHATAEQRAEAERLDPLARSAFWAHEAENDPRDVDAGVHLAHALRDLGRYQEAAESAERVLVVAPTNFEAILEVGRGRIAQGQGFYAIDPLQHAATAQPTDYRPVSLLAVAYEQVQRDDEALAAYQRAMSMAPGNAGLVSNLALYWAGHGDTAQAEQLLRRAVAMPTATAQTRQNLALVLGLQGRLDEAERLERQDLPPETVANNMAYLRAAATGAAGSARSWDAVRGTQTP